jgi:hypothetical protein
VRLAVYRSGENSTEGLHLPSVKVTGKVYGVTCDEAAGTQSAFAVLSPLDVMYLAAFADGLLVGQIASSAHHGRSGLASARNQIRGHDGHGNRSALGRVTGRGRVRRDQPL